MKIRKNKVTITRRHCESGSVHGRWYNKKIDCSWNSHELWINGQLNPEDHPLEEAIQGSIEDCDNHIKTIATLNTGTDISDVPFEAIITGAGIVDFSFVLEISHKEVKAITLEQLVQEIGVTTKEPILIRICD